LTSEAAAGGVGRLAFEPHNCFVCGELNAAGLQLQIHAEDGRGWTETALSGRFEGWEGVVHGGILSAIADEVMAWAVISTGELGVTVRMETEFRQPVTVGQAIRADGWITDRRRRRFETAARLVDRRTEDVLVEARAAYLAVPAGQAEKLRARYGFRTGQAGAGTARGPVGAGGSIEGSDSDLGVTVGAR
jgi:acyl-coenzyme A thioesterase PaaI-like protein